jgi:putative endonuclease
LSIVNCQLSIVNGQQSTVSGQRSHREASHSAVFVYIVECADQTLYTGWTTNVERRLKAHNAGRGAKYTQQRGPVRLVYMEELPDRRTAQKRELEIKRMSRAGKLKLIERSRLNV